MGQTARRPAGWKPTHVTAFKTRNARRGERLATGVNTPQDDTRPSRVSSGQLRSDPLMQLRHSQSTTVARPPAPKSTRSNQRPVEKPVEFTLRWPQARSVAVAGTFNDWDANRTPMSPSPAGAWQAAVWLPAGRYEYRFIVDGQWISDPGARECVQNTFGSTNSVLVV